MFGKTFNSEEWKFYQIFSFIIIKHHLFFP